jgi:putative two-component system response regulator
MQVLIAEDDDISREIMENALIHAGFDVIMASDGLDALAKLRAGNCRLVITDWDMPGMNGIELCHAIRRGEFAGYVYTILLTSHDSLQKTIDGLSAGADDFIKKPFDPGELVVRVRCGERVVSLETREVAIFAMAKLAESRDPDTGAHLERVRNYCRVLAQQLVTQSKFGNEIDGEFIRLLYATSPLHDIGKVGIPDCVLLKHGLLNDSEYALMKTHAELGAKTLEAALAQFPQAKFLRMARDIAMTHHERWDGTGYPRGLHGEQIPLCGRIVALADVYDALTSKRVYKDSYDHDVARSIIVEAAGAHFDPDIVTAFLACEEQFIATRRHYSDEQRADSPQLDPSTRLEDVPEPTRVELAPLESDGRLLWC